MNNKSGIALTHHITVYLDILGLREQMIASASDPTRALTILRSYHASVNRALKVLRLWSTPEDKAFGSLWKSKVFTDNIILSFPKDKTSDGESEFGLASMMTAEFQLSLALDGWFVRGGLAYGLLFMDSEVVFGPALVEAYELESAKARDPRVILSDKAAKLVEHYLKYYAHGGYNAPQNGYVFVDTDSAKAINYLYAPIGVDEIRGHLLGALRQHKERVLEKIESFKDRPLIWSKFRWVAGYHNFFCKRWVPEVKNLRIRQSDLGVEPNLLVEKPAWGG